MLGVLVLVGGLAVDGDTIRSNGMRIRLWGIDAPEMSEVQGPRSKAVLQNIVDRAGQLTCYEMGRDRYGRIVARCHDAQGYDIGCTMIAARAADEWQAYSRGYYGGCDD